jgi:predicted lipid-binding transport protein (Tim44 family)
MKGATMIGLLAIVFILLWTLGMLSSFTMGGFLHTLIGAAVVLLCIQIIGVTIPGAHRGRSK